MSTPEEVVARWREAMAGKVKAAAPNQSLGPIPQDPPPADAGPFLDPRVAKAMAASGRPAPSLPPTGVFSVSPYPEAGKPRENFPAEAASAPPTPPGAPTPPPSATLADLAKVPEQSSPAPGALPSPAGSGGSGISVSGPIGAGGLMASASRKYALKTGDIETELGKARQEQQKGIQEAQDANARLAGTQAQVHELYGLKMEAEQARYQEARAKAEAKAADQDAAVTKAIDEVSRLHEPTRRNPYAEGGGGKGAALVLLSAISGAAAGFRGRESQALEIINANVERDYAEAKEANEAKRKNLTTQQQIYRDLKGRVRDEDELHAAFRATIFQDVQRRLALAVDLAGTEAKKGDLMQAMGLVGRQAEMDKLALREKTFSALEQDETRRANAMAHAATLSARGESGSPRERMQQREESKYVIPGHTYNKKGSPAPTEKDYEQAKPIAAAIESWNANIGQLMRLREKNGGTLIPTRMSGDDRATMEGLVRELKLTRKTAENMGAALTTNEELLMNLADPNMIGQMLPQLMVANKSFNAKTETMLGNLGYKRDVPFAAEQMDKPKY